MISLKDLKQNILNGNLNHFYVFYGDDFGLRQHYINKIGESFSKIRTVKSVEDIYTNSTGSGLFKTSYLYVVYNDVDFMKARRDLIGTFIRRQKDDCVILVYEQAVDSSNLFKNFGEYITYFPTVEDNIALEFVDSEITLSLESKIELARNCKNYYSKICLEADKIKNYAEAKGINTQIAYDDLRNSDQLLYEYPKYDPNDLMDDVLQGNFRNLGYWCKVINEVYSEEFWIMLNSIFNNYLIAYLIKKYGKFPGSSRAFDFGLPWYRTKQIREFEIPYTADYLYQCAREVASLDSKMKTGGLTQDKLFDYFLTVIV